MAVGQNNVVLPPKPPEKPSFAQILTGNIIKTFSNDVKEFHVPVSSYKGEPAIVFTKNQIQKLAEPFKYTLVGKFMHGRPSMEAIRKMFTTLNLKGEYSIGLMDSRHVLIRLFNEADFHRIWLKDQWYVYNYPMKVLKWTPYFNINVECPIIPTWITFPALQPHLFEKSALESIASGVGKPLQVDASTATLARPSLARVCVEIDVSKPLVKRVWIACEDDGYWQSVNYENVPSYCKKCERFNHDEKDCGKNEEIPKLDQIIVTVPKDDPKTKQQWIMVNHDRRDKQKKSTKSNMSPTLKNSNDGEATQTSTEVGKKSIDDQLLENIPSLQALVEDPSSSSLQRIVSELVPITEVVEEEEEEEVDEEILISEHMTSTALSHDENSLIQNMEVNPLARSLSSPKSQRRDFKDHNMEVNVGYSSEGGEPRDDTSVLEIVSIEDNTKSVMADKKKKYTKKIFTKNPDQARQTRSSTKNLFSQGSISSNSQ